MEIKVNNGVTKIWQGDLCLPRPAWDGLNCKDNGYEPPINRTTTRIFVTNAKLNKPVSGFALDVNVPYLKFEINHLIQTIICRNLSGNKLSGSVPSALLERSNNGFLSLRFVFTQKS